MKLSHFTGLFSKVPAEPPVSAISAPWSRPWPNRAPVSAVSTLHVSLQAKAAALGFSLCLNHAFVDGNKRVAHAAMEVLLTLNGYEIVAALDEQERFMLDLAAGSVTREQLTGWLEKHLQRVG